MASINTRWCRSVRVSRFASAKEAPDNKQPLAIGTRAELRLKFHAYASSLRKLVLSLACVGAKLLHTYLFLGEARVSEAWDISHLSLFVSVVALADHKISI